MKPAKAKETKAQLLEDLKSTLRKWQQIEDESVQKTDAILAVAKNPLIRLVIEILRHDSVMHKKVQQVILDSLEKEAFSLQPEELADIWEMIEKHDEIEKEAIRMATEARKSCPFVIQQQLLDYLIEDEKKHDRLLGNLEGFKKRLHPYG
jgi:Ribonuclease G/E